MPEVSASTALIVVANWARDAEDGDVEWIADALPWLVRVVGTVADVAGGQYVAGQHGGQKRAQAAALLVPALEALGQAAALLVEAAAVVGDRPELPQVWRTSRRAPASELPAGLVVEAAAAVDVEAGEVVPS